ncbi:hypothetical protein tinsulaeT_03850 [Thalassotalea insulae]|uniref:Uncharacterized protein n=1 Tax=Thalassotalea insulae TaxID=2056778 RepID=A0ABQ6GQT3_9GAMM|nr:hypothetical protein tinsulaeT_03850 [Thalassotalea insulae]
MVKGRKISHSTQRKRIIARQKHKLNCRRMLQFLQENQS